MSDQPVGAQPYVGPRAFSTAEREWFFGREREATELCNRLIAQRIVLLHAPSGAGKSSLIHAGLLPLLTNEGFRVNPTIRLSDPRAAGRGINRFVAATLLTLDLPLPAPTTPTATDFAALAALLDRRLDPDADEVLIFDQFEEVLTLDPTDQPAKEAFFRFLSATLENPHRWVLFALREDHLGALRPYLRFLPFRLAAQYRLDLLGPEQALQAIRRPPERLGVTFIEEAARKLVGDLSRTIVDTPSGPREVFGEVVEPVQLQVVCLRLWGRLFGQRPPPEGRAITLDDLEEIGDVDSALAGYYAEQVRTIAAATGVSERAIRDWFDRHLITPDQRRDQVRREAAQSGGLPEAAVASLVDSHLVRGEERRGTMWLELAHDRLIGPITRNNAEWREANLRPFQRQAALWEEQGRPSGLLIRDETLVEEEAWATTHPDAVTKIERQFLAACIEARQARERELRQNRLLRLALFFVTGLGVLAMVLLAAALMFWQRSVEDRERAEHEAHNARIRQLAAEALATSGQQPQTGLLLARAAVERAAPTDPSYRAAQESLRASLALAGGLPLRGHEQAVRAVAVSRDGRRIATAGDDATIRLWNPDGSGAAVLQGHGDHVTALTFVPSGDLLASASIDGTVRLWQLDALERPPAVLRAHDLGVIALDVHPSEPWLLTGSQDGTARLWRLDQPDLAPEVLLNRGNSVDVGTVAFSPDGRWIGAGVADGSVWLWPTAAYGSGPLPLTAHTLAVASLAFSQNGQALLTASADGTARLWDLDRLDRLPPVPLVFGKGGEHQAAVTAAAFTSDGTRIATAAADGTLRLWRADDDAAPISVLSGHSGMINRMGFSPDGAWLATVSADGTARLWPMGNNIRPPVTLRGHEAPLTALAFAPDGAFLVTGSEDATARSWQVSRPAATPMILYGHAAALARVAYSPDGQWLATSGFDGTARLWRANDPDSSAVLTGHGSAVRALAFSPDGRWLASGGDDDRVRLWAVTLPATLVAELPPDSGDITSVAFSEDGRWLVSTSRGGSARVWTVAGIHGAGLPLMEFSGIHGSITHALFVPGRALLAAWEKDGTLRLWPLEPPGASPVLLGQDRQPLETVSASPDGRWLAAAGQDGVVRLWRTEPSTDNPIELRGHQATVFDLAFSPDGALIASASSDRTVRLWQTARPAAPPRVLEEHTDPVKAVAFSRDGSWLASAGSDKTARLYAIGPDLGAITLRGHGDTVIALAFSPDGSRLLTGSNDRTARLWEVDAENLATLACTTAGRNFSYDEWRLFFGEVEYRPICPAMGRHVSYFTHRIKNGAFDEAVEAYISDWQRDPAMAPPAVWLARIAAGSLAAGDVALAQAAFERARQLDSAFASVSAMTFDAICRFGWAQNALALALEGCNRAVAIDPDNANFAYNRAFVLAPLNRYAEAIADLRQFLQLAGQYRGAESKFKQVQEWIAELEQGRLPPPMAPPPDR